MSPAGGTLPAHGGDTNNKYYNADEANCDATHCYTRRADDSFASWKKVLSPTWEDRCSLRDT